MTIIVVLILISYPNQITTVSPPYVVRGDIALNHWNAFAFFRLFNVFVEKSPSPVMHAPIGTYLYQFALYT